MKESTIRRLIKIVEESEIESLEVTRFFRKIRITKKLSSNGTGDPSAIVVNAPSEPVAAPPATPAQPEKPAVAAEDTSGLIEVVSPMVGTFYRSPSPDSDPFVTVSMSTIIVSLSSSRASETPVKVISPWVLPEVITMEAPDLV